MTSVKECKNDKDSDKPSTNDPGTQEETAAEVEVKVDDNAIKVNNVPNNIVVFTYVMNNKHVKKILVSLIHKESTNNNKVDDREFANPCEKYAVRCSYSHSPLERSSQAPQ